LLKLFIKEQKFGENVMQIIIVSETRSYNHSLLTSDGARSLFWRYL